MNLTLRQTIERVRTWGLKGIFDFLKSRWTNHRLKKDLARSIRHHLAAPAHGITLVARLSEKHSLSKTMRDFAFRLKDAGVPFQTFDLSPRLEVPAEDVAPILTPRQDFNLAKYDHIVEMFHAPLPDGLPAKRSRIVFWEFESGLLEYDPKINDGHDIIAMSDFNLRAFKSLLPASTDIRKVLYPLHFETEQLPPAGEIRDRYGIGRSDFVVFFNFDLGSSYYRKNPESTVRAFALAFRNTPDARLIFKVQGARQHADKLIRLRSLAAELNIGDRLTTITAYLPQRDLYGLTNASDVYISLHRGEGFGLGIAEAMSLGKPVVVTDYSAPTEFCTAENSIPVPFKIVPVLSKQVDNPCYRFVEEWAEPDIEAAANALIRLHDDEALRRRLGANGQRTLREHFSTDVFRKSIEAFLDS